MTQAEICELQAALSLLGFHPGARDGVLGVRTQDAVEACLSVLPAVPVTLWQAPDPLRAAGCRLLLVDALDRLARRLPPCPNDTGDAGSARDALGGEDD
ncbi:MAG: peptidoglycan-binding domain-containing protein [Pseudomonadota bacterium]